MQVKEWQAAVRWSTIRPPVTTPENKGVNTLANRRSAPAFQQILEKQLGGPEELRFSSHAMQRLQERNLTPSPQELNRLLEGVSRVAAKGGRQSVILVDDTAYVVSVKNRTVVTAMEKGAAQENVFTNIDSVAIV